MLFCSFTSMIFTCMVVQNRLQMKERRIFFLYFELYDCVDVSKRLKISNYLTLSTPVHCILSYHLYINTFVFKKNFNKFIPLELFKAVDVG